ncbi:MAG TPA: hypothetical protein P5550_01175 [Bacteroidales bacterium]|nr:hypothetical protein [Bacteroidales bacterium]
MQESGTGPYPDLISEASRKAWRWAVEHDFSGSDPYDALLSPFPFRLFGKWGEVAAIQLFKRSPFNLRPLFAVPTGHNPKALGLFLETASRLQRGGDPDAAMQASRLFSLITEKQSQGFSGACWGYHFPWSGPAKRLPPGYPSTVVTAMVGRGLQAWYEVSQDDRVKAVLAQVPAFLMNDIAHTDDATGLCFSYTPAARDLCYNASLFAAETLARCDAVAGEEELRGPVTRAVEFVLSRQKPDGGWLYSEDPQSGRERVQIDFHQGFILDSLFHIRRLYRLNDPALDEAMWKGADFYLRKQFTPEGRSLRRLPRQWPADIHAQAQGIITFSLLRELDPRFLPFAETLALWTIRNMMSEDGAFHYQKYPFFSIKTPFMRWGQAWMVNALTCLSAGERSDI